MNRFLKMGSFETISLFLDNRKYGKYLISYIFNKEKIKLNG